MKKADNHIQQELEAITPHLANMGSGMPFGLPEGYFEGFPENMLLLVKAENIAGVPAGYFEQFAGKMMLKLRSIEVHEELETLSPLLNSIPKTMPFTIPEGYFNQWSPSIQKETIKQPAKVFSLSKGLPWKKWVAAAAILLTAGISWQYFVNQPVENDASVAINSADPSLDTLLIKVDANSLTGYLENEQANSELSSLISIAQQDIETGVKQLSNEELNWYLENQAIEIPGT